MSRLFVRICKQSHTFFEGYKVPVGATYGRSIIYGEEWFWTCTDYSGLKSGKLHIHFMKREWLSNQSCHVARMTWHEILIGSNHEIYRQILSILRELGGIPKIKSYEPQRKVKMPLSEIKTIGRRRAQVTQDSVFRVTNPSYLSGYNLGSNTCPVVNNQNSYWENKHDVVRTTVNYGGNIY